MAAPARARSAAPDHSRSASRGPLLLDKPRHRVDSARGRVCVAVDCTFRIPGQLPAIHDFGEDSCAGRGNSAGAGGCPPLLLHGEKLICLRNRDLGETPRGKAGHRGLTVRSRANRLDAMLLVARGDLLLDKNLAASGGGLLGLFPIQSSPCFPCRRACLFRRLSSRRTVDEPKARPDLRLLCIYIARLVFHRIGVFWAGPDNRKCCGRKTGVPLPPLHRLVNPIIPALPNRENNWDTFYSRTRHL